MVLDFRKYSSVEELSSYIWEQQLQKTAQVSDHMFSLSDIAFTLQVGREFMEERWAAVVTDPQDLLEKLTAFIEDSELQQQSWLRGTVKKGKLSPLLLGDDEDSLELIERWTRKGKLDKLAELWISGVNIDWTNFPGHRNRKIISLPLYPFAKERYWIDSTVRREYHNPSASEITPNHPFVDGIDLTRSMEHTGLVYYKTYKPNDTVLKDHIINGYRTLPGAVLIEMVCESYRQISGNNKINLTNIVWMVPVIVQQDQLTVRVEFTSNQGVQQFYVCSGENEQVVSHAKGEISSSKEDTEKAAVLPLKEIRSSCTALTTGSQVYSQFEQREMKYGPYFRNILEIWGNTGQSLAEIKIPDIALPELTFCNISPSLLDAALQSIAGITGMSDGFSYNQTLVPFSVRNITIRKSAEAQMLAHVLKVAENLYDVTLCDLSGNVYVYMENVELRAALYLQPPTKREGNVDMKVQISAAPPATVVKEKLEAQLSIEDLRLRAETVIRKSLSSVLHIDESEFDHDMPYIDFGVDSVLSIEIINRINEQLRISLRSVDLFNYGSIRQLSNHLVKEYATEINGTLNHSKPAPSLEPQNKNLKGEQSVSTTSSIEIPETSTDIAIIGISGRFPGADSVHEFWDNISKGVNSVKVVSRWNEQDYYDEDPQKTDKSYSKWMGQLANTDQFDPLFFSISPKEAAMMDPQQRIFLMEAWRAIEDAGYSISALDNQKCGVFVGCGSGDYMDLMKEQGVVPSAYAFMGNDESILPARISYFLNLKGPSIAVNTACSSSLVALHLACESIRCGTSDMALAGGISVLNTPRVHVLSSRAGMLSTDGQCKAFDNQANGFVPSEGVGVVLLKPLKAALVEGDHIYGVIKGSGINQDGKTNGLTAPSAPSQTALELDIYKQFGIDPSDIQYVEAHGTGTKLGDPIEIAALTDAFRKFTDQKGYCAIGSVKSNIGHSLPAAGIAGLIKVLLSLKHRKLAPTILVEKENEHIDFANSPFFVNRRLSNWNPIPGKPRLAAISSFGFSGTNAHVVIEESPVVVNNPISKHPYEFVPVSATNDRVLHQKERELLSYLEGEGRTVPFEDIIYTLQSGRSHFSVRHGYIVRNIEDLCAKLRERSEGSTNFEGYLEGNTNIKRSELDKRDQTLVTSLMQQLSDSSLSLEAYKDSIMQVAALFVNGEELNFHLLHSQSSRRRVPLPTYPFQLQHCWFESKTQANSDFMSGMYSSLQKKKSGDVLAIQVISPLDNIVCHHRVSGHKIFPGSGFLALSEQVLVDLDAERVFSVADVIFLRPLFLQNEPVELKLRLVEHSPWFFEMISEQHGNLVVHVTGEFKKSKVPSIPGQIGKLAIEDIRISCSSYYQDEGIYTELQKIGLEYGPAFRGVKEIWGGINEALGRLELPDSCIADSAFGRFHPAFLDAALHTIAGINPSIQTVVPFSLNSIEVLQPLHQKAYAYVLKEGERSYTVQVTDAAGNICLILRGLVLIEVNNRPVDIGDSLYVPHWELSKLSTFDKEKPADTTILILGSEKDSGLQGALSAEHMGCNVINVHFGERTRRLSSKHWIIQIKDTEALIKFLDDVPKIDVVYFLGGLQIGPDTQSAPLDTLEQSQQEGIFSLFRLVKYLSSRGNHELVLKVVTNFTIPVHSNQLHLPNGASMHGFVKSLAKEYPSWKVSIIDIDLIGQQDLQDSPNKIHHLANSIIHEPAHPKGEVVAIRSGERYQCILKTLSLQKPDSVPFRHNGVYMIIGGAGGIGMEFSKYLSSVAQAHIVLVGRRPIDQTIEIGLKGVCSLGGTADYMQAVALDPSSVSMVVGQIKKKYGVIHGAVHSAIVLRDRIIENMSENDFRASLDIKVKGSAVLRHALADEPLDFVLFFSSIQSFSGNPGQSNYAAGCTFKDALGHVGNTKATDAVLTRNGCDWGKVGVVSSEAYNRSLGAMGIQSISPQEGMEVISRTIANQSSQVIAFKADRHVLDQLGVEANLPSVSDDGQLFLPSKFPVLEDSQRDNIITAFNHLAEFGKTLLLNAFRHMGVFHTSGEHYDSAKLSKQLRIIPKYARFLGAMLKILEHSGLIKQEDGFCVTTYLVDTVPVIETFEQLEEKKCELIIQYSDIKAHLELLWALFQNYREILTGEVPSTDIMFPKGSSILVENIYKNNLIADYFNQIVAYLVVDHLEKNMLQQNRKLKILEIGAGTGGTTSHVLPYLKKYSERIEYVYSDISFGFTQFGRTRFKAEFPFVTFKTLDIEKDFYKQGYAEGEFDVIVATNVMHATSHINRALSQCRALLREGGQLIINELTKVHDFATLTLGLLDGWWLYEDEDVRLPDAPLLSAHGWIKHYQDHGFADVSAHGEEQLGQNVISGSKSALKNTFVHSVTLEANQEIIKEHIQQILRDNLQKAMGLRVEDIHEERAFSSYGVDSISGVDLIRKINEELNIVLRTTALFDYSTLKELSGHIWNEFGEDLLNRKQEEEESEKVPEDHLSLLERLAEGSLSINQVIEKWR
ncbi:hypothetical protein AMQ83_06715 [Paenibacillus riograndensis]|nr:hypothetical protein AMQ83_06715 [Paenibacillus riograndensis]